MQAYEIVDDKYPSLNINTLVLIDCASCLEIMNSYSAVVLFCLIDEIFSYYKFSGYELEQIQVLFRHGDRVPDKEEVYRTDPYDDLYKKLGYGQLTNVGKQREYQIGKILRQRYGDFIGDFNINDVYAYSTNYDRTKSSLQLVLAGLYPPSEEQTWSKNINWSPIPTFYETIGNDFLINFFCPTFFDMMEKVQKSSAMKMKLKKYENLFLYLQEKTGISTDTILPVALLHANIRAIINMGLRIPNWCTDDVFNKLEEITALYYKTMTSTREMTKIIVGPTIEEFLKNIKDNDEQRKIYMYSAHDFNIATFTQSHNMTDIPMIPDYGSALILEKLRGQDHRIYLRFFLWTGVSSRWISLKMKDCNYVCPLIIYEKLVSSISPDGSSKDCIIARNGCKQKKSYLDNFNPSGRLTYSMVVNDLLSFKYAKSISHVN